MKEIKLVSSASAVNGVADRNLYGVFHSGSGLRGVIIRDQFSGGLWRAHSTGADFTAGDTFGIGHDTLLACIQSFLVGANNHVFQFENSVDLHRWLAGDDVEHFDVTLKEVTVEPVLSLSPDVDIDQEDGIIGIQYGGSKGFWQRAKFRGGKWQAVCLAGITVKNTWDAFDDSSLATGILKMISYTHKANGNYQFRCFRFNNEYELAQWLGTPVSE